VSKTFNVGAILLIVLLAVGLYKAKSEADATRAHVAALEAEVAAARAEIKTMSAEAAYLENPDRVEQLARKELGLKPASLGQHKTLSELDSVLPPPRAPKKPPASIQKETP
jgi:cell division protein FtsL